MVFTKTLTMCDCDCDCDCDYSARQAWSIQILLITQACEARSGLTCAGCSDGNVLDCNALQPGHCGCCGNWSVGDDGAPVTQQYNRFQLPL